MILKQKFKTLEGCRKRVDFENAHKTPGNKNMHYQVAWFFDGKRMQPQAITRQQLETKLCHWQIEKVRI